MQRFAGIGPVVAVLVGVGWWIVKAIIDRREEADSWGDDIGRPAAPPPHVPHRNEGTAPPVITKPSPKSTPPVRPPFMNYGRRAQKPAAPPVVVGRSTNPVPLVRPVIIQSEPEGPIQPDLAHLAQSKESYQRAANIQQSVADRLAAIDRQTVAHRAAAVQQRAKSESAARVLEAFRHPATIRQALLASFVLNPPKSLE